MITKFKQFERYSGAGSAIGFRYSEPTENEANRCVITFVVTPGDGIPDFYKMNNINKKVNILDIKEVESKIKKSIEKVNLDYKTLVVDKLKRNIWTISLDFYVYSFQEGTVITRNIAYVIDMCGYQILDLVQNTPYVETPKKIGFRYKGYEEEETKMPSMMGSGAYGASFPSEEFEI